MTFSDYLSIFALLISAISLGLSWRQFLRDRSWLGCNIILQDKHGDFTYLVRLVNSGRRPLTVRQTYARVRSGKRYPVFDTTTPLEETQSIEFSVPLMDFSKAPNDPDNILAFEVEDTTGKNHIFKTKYARKVRA